MSLAYLNQLRATYPELDHKRRAKLYKQYRKRPSEAIYNYLYADAARLLLGIYGTLKKQRKFPPQLRRHQIDECLASMMAAELPRMLAGYDPDKGTFAGSGWRYLSRRMLQMLHRVAKQNDVMIDIGTLQGSDTDDNDDNQESVWEQLLADVTPPIGFGDPIRELEAEETLAALYRASALPSKGRVILERLGYPKPERGGVDLATRLEQSFDRPVDDAEDLTM
jgi:hypothetical protein